MNSAPPGDCPSGQHHHLLDLDSSPVNAPAIDPASHARYCATVAQVTTHPGLARSLPCLVCGDSHSFDSCPVLQNHDFLKEHYIAFVGFLKRDTGIRQHRTGSLPPLLAPPRPRSVHAITAAADDVGVCDESDFHEGRE
jgi:hypothetical protein